MVEDLRVFRHVGFLFLVAKHVNGYEGSMDNHRTLYLPEGVAHGFQTLTDECEVHYQMGRGYVPEAARGVRWNDPLFAIEWPEPPVGDRIISERDRSYGEFAP